ncbi:unnamed protein product, partial [Discosporangium mesarthrocarpum]
GGFARYDRLVASWRALPQGNTLSAAAMGYMAAMRRALSDPAPHTPSWAVARALASAADMHVLAGKGRMTIPMYKEACTILEKTAAVGGEAEGFASLMAVATPASGGTPAQRTQEMPGDAQEMHKVGRMLKDLALLVADAGEAETAIRLFQRAVEVHLSSLAGAGRLVSDVSEAAPGPSAPNPEPPWSFVPLDLRGADWGDDRGQGATITGLAVAADTRPLHVRLRSGLRGALGALGGGLGGESTGNANCGGIGNVRAKAGGRGAVPPIGPLDVAASCAADLGQVVGCARSLRDRGHLDEAVLVSEKVLAVLVKVVGPDHDLTKAALAGIVGQGVVDKCWSRELGNSFEGAAPELGSPPDPESLPAPVVGTPPVDGVRRHRTRSDVLSAAGTTTGAGAVRVYPWPADEPSSSSPFTSKRSMELLFGNDSGGGSRGGDGRWSQDPYGDHSNITGRRLSGLGGGIL